MAVYLISCALRKPDHDYKPLYEALDELAAERIQDPVWGLNSENSASAVFDYLWKHLHSQKNRQFVVPYDLLSAHLGHDFRVISPAVYRRFLRVWTAST
jgi:hypothetical protein